MASRTALKLLRQARNNDPEAQYRLGELYLAGGEGISPNTNAAAMWLRRAANQGLEDASTLIARHIAPTSTPEPEWLLPHYEHNAEKGDVTAAFHAALLWQEKRGEDAEHRMRDYLKRAADGGHLEAQLMLARLLQHEQAGGDSVAQALLARAAESGSPEATTALAERFWQKQDASGVALFRKLARKTEPLWAYRLGMMLRRAAESQSPREALLAESTDWLATASDAGLPEAMFEYGSILGGLAPGVVRRNYKRAARLLENALTLGVAEAGLRIAALHDNPRLPGRNPALALDALGKAARLGFPDAQYQFVHRQVKRKTRGQLRDQAFFVSCLRWLHEAHVAGHGEAAALMDEIAHAPPVYAPSTRAYQAHCIAEFEQTHPELACRLNLAASFYLNKAEMLLIDPAAADCGVCLALPQRTAAPRVKGRLIQVATPEQRAALDVAIKALSSNAEDANESFPQLQRAFSKQAKRIKLDWPRFMGDIV